MSFSTLKPKNRLTRATKADKDDTYTCFCSVARFLNDCRKTKTKAITPTNHNKDKQLLEPIRIPTITCNSPEAREKSRVHGALGFGFASHWLKNWHESFKPITKRSNRNHVITFDSHLKTALKH